MVAESRRYNVAACGRRFGKTFLALDVLIDGPRHKGALHGFPVALYAPTYQTMLESWRKLVHVLKPITLKKSDSDHRLDLLTGGVIECWSLDNPDAGRGRKYATVVIDEAAMIKRLEEGWGQNILPLLLDYRGEAWIISTPKGNNYFHQLFARGWPSNPQREEDWQSWQLPTWVNPYISRNDIDALRRTMTQLGFLQEIEAQFVAAEGAAMRREWLKVGEPAQALSCVMGVDLALSTKQDADYSACVVLARDADGRIFVLDAQRVRASFHAVLQFIQSMAAQWQPTAIAIESVQYQAAAVQELLRTTTLPVRGVKPDGDKLTRFQPLLARYEQGLVYHAPQLPHAFTDELLSFPLGQHDDQVDALSYAWRVMGVAQGRPVALQVSAL